MHPLSRRWKLVPSRPYQHELLRSSARSRQLADRVPSANGLRPQFVSPFCGQCSIVSNSVINSASSIGTVPPLRPRPARRRGGGADIEKIPQAAAHLSIRSLNDELNPFRGGLPISPAGAECKRVFDYYEERSVRLWQPNPAASRADLARSALCGSIPELWSFLRAPEGGHS